MTAGPESPPFGERLPEIRTAIPGPRSLEHAARLRAVESRNVTLLDEGWPVFWGEARGANVRDVDGNVYVDLTSAFGVALLGHGAGGVRAAVERQAASLVHGMGDIHPPAIKMRLLERLAALAPFADARIVLSTTGSEAVESALKTGALASGRPGVLAFEGAYHGLTLGALAATHRDHFRAPFEPRLYAGVAFAPFPDPLRDGEKAAARSLEAVSRLLDDGAPNGDPIGTLVIEPVQARAGARVPPPGFLAALSDLAAARDVVVVADEVYTGLGRCGATFASVRLGLRPDVVCVGKALGGGLPVSACIGSRRVMDAWPPSSGEAIHTSTFLGHPLACAAALAALDALESDDVAGRAERLGAALAGALSERLAGVEAVGEVRGLGLLLGVELVRGRERAPYEGAAVAVAEAALGRGVIVLPAGAEGHVVELTPPVTLTKGQMEHALDVLAHLVEECT